MADPTYQPKVYRKQGGDELVVADGGTITVQSGGGGRRDRRMQHYGAGNPDHLI